MQLLTRAPIDDDLLRILAEHVPGFSPAFLDTPFAALPIDSFGLVTLRARMEALAGADVSDDVWLELDTPRQLLDLVAGGRRLETDEAGQAVAVRRRYRIGMPQLGVGGLSEGWLFREAGDLHWEMISRVLQTPASAITDAEGRRLYATFVRVRLRADAPLRAFGEDEELLATGAVSRFGAGLFFSRLRFQGTEAAITLDLMSSFARRDEQESNLSLARGYPRMPEGAPGAVLTDMPAFGVEYQLRRRQGPPAMGLGSCDYRLSPEHDINGVGLVYFAAFPPIADACERRLLNEEPGWAARASVQERDIVYFANAEIDDTLVCRAHRIERDEAGLDTESSLLRQGDGVLMALIRTRKVVHG